MSRRAELIGLILVTLAVPLGIRALNARSSAPHERLSYLPVFEGTRENPFAAHRLSELRSLDPGYVVIGDSMAGTRIDERVLGELAGRPVAPLLQAGSGPVFWYLALKNWVIASGIKPRVVFIFFRDTNLTDTMFRLDEQYRWSLDFVATDQLEPEVQAIVESRIGGTFHRAHARLEALYGGDRARRWIEPAIVRWPVEFVTASRRRQAQVLQQANERFGLDHLRQMEAADMAVTDAGLDFHDDVETSVLPLMLREAQQAGVTLCLVRAQRRPVGGKPPEQSSALQRYMRDLRAYVESRGGVLHDETGDPELTLDMYADGDHIAREARARHTRILYQRLRHLFP